MCRLNYFDRFLKYLSKVFIVLNVIKIFSIILGLLLEFRGFIFESIKTK